MELPTYWNHLSDLLVEYLDRKVDFFTLQTYGRGYEFGPYVQVLHENENQILLEATSNSFLVPHLSKEGHQKLVFMGWRLFPEHYLPNYTQFLDLGSTSSREIAEKLLSALYFAYGVDSSFGFNLAPHPDEALIYEPTKPNLKVIGV
jgi:hypothetical protein